MFKSRDYCNHVETNEIAYTPGDVMVLYTDGITEAKNAKGDEFGSEQLLQTLLEVKDKASREIQEHLINCLYEFSGSKEIDDDYTTMIVRFR
jgi:sigma-B regulation protein RsbU (phosphoserine phosphatase)